MLKKTVLVLVALCTLGLFAGCKHDAGESEPSLPGTWYSYEVVEVFEVEPGRDADPSTCIYKFNADGELTGVNYNGLEPSDLSPFSGATEFFISVTLAEDGSVSSLILRGEERVTEENASAFSYEVTDEGITVSAGSDGYVLQKTGIGLYSLTDKHHGNDVTWKFKKAE